jgi:N-dimethylarginine dimethylaminohydrolase
MCPPTYFDVVYDINPWMGETMRGPEPVDRPLAEAQWTSLVETYRAIGHTVQVIEPQPGLPDMVFTANAGTVVAGKALTARFRHVERQGEESLFADWLGRNDVGRVRIARNTNEGEGDFALAGDLLLAGYGFRTSAASHREAARFFGMPVVSLRLVDPRYYHLDTALCVLDDRLLAWFPPAFDPPSQEKIARLFPDAIVATPEDASMLGLNLFCDGYHAVLPSGAGTLSQDLRARGFEPVPVDLSELRKAGGSIKCCTLELRR